MSYNVTFSGTVTFNKDKLVNACEAEGIYISVTGEKNTYKFPDTINKLIDNNAMMCHSATVSDKEVTAYFYNDGDTTNTMTSDVVCRMDSLLEDEPGLIEDFDMIVYGKDAGEVCRYTLVVDTIERFAAQVVYRFIIND